MMNSNFYALSKIQERIASELENKNIFESNSHSFFIIKVSKNGVFEYAKIEPLFENERYVYYNFDNIHYLFEKEENTLTLSFVADDVELKDKTRRVFLFEEAQEVYVINHMLNGRSKYHIEARKKNGDYTFSRTDRPYSGKLRQPESKEIKLSWNNSKYTLKKELIRYISSL